MKKNVIILILLLGVIKFINSTITVTSVSPGPEYGTKNVPVTVTGTGYTVGATTTIQINNLACGSAKCSTTTSCSCTLTVVLTPGNGSFDVEVKQGTLSAIGTGLFKYLVPTISNHVVKNGEIIITLANSPKTTSDYRLSIDNGIDKLTISNSLPNPPDQIYLLPQDVVGGEVFNLKLLDPFGFVHAPFTQNVYPTVSPMSQTEFDVDQGTDVVITGSFFGKTATVVIGTYEIPVNVSVDSSSCSVSFTTPTVFESPLIVQVKTSAGKIINTTVDGQTLKPQEFTYIPATVDSFTQNGTNIEFNTTNTGTDAKFIVVKYKSSPLTIISFVNRLLVVAVPHALDKGESTFEFIANNQTAIQKTLLIKPVVTKATNVPPLGGNVTITGVFLNNAYVAIINVNKTKTNLNCTSNINGESINCQLGPGNGSIALIISNYKNYPSDQTEQSTSIDTKYLIPETPTPTKPITPSPTPTNPITSTPTPTQKKVVITNPPIKSSSHKLMVPFSIIIYSIVSLSLLI